MLGSIFFFSENCEFYEIMSKKYGGVGDATDNMTHARCMLDK
jgi:hypothetical protein